MNGKAVILLIMIILLVATGYIGIQCILGMHEQTHVKINDVFNIRSEVEIGLMDGSVAYIPVNLTKDEAKQLKVYHLLNELVTYQFYNFYLILYPMFALIMFLMMLKVFE